MAIRNPRRSHEVGSGAANSIAVDRRHLKNLDRLLWPMTNQFPEECSEAWFAACDARWRMRIAELMREIEAEHREAAE